MSEMRISKDGSNLGFHKLNNIFLSKNSSINFVEWNPISEMITRSSSSRQTCFSNQYTLFMCKRSKKIRNDEILENGLSDGLFTHASRQNVAHVSI